MNDKAKEILPYYNVRNIMIRYIKAFVSQYKDMIRFDTDLHGEYIFNYLMNDINTLYKTRLIRNSEFNVLVDTLTEELGKYGYKPKE